MADTWYILNGVKVLGPLSAEQLQQFARQGKLTHETKVAKDKDGPWVPAARIKGLLPTLATLPQPGKESLIWTGSPSHIANLGAFIVCGLLFWLIFPLLIILWKWLENRCTKYELTTERFRISHGVLSRRTDELELYRVKDTTFDQPFFLRLFALANILITSSDEGTPLTAIKAIPANDAKSLRETLRNNVERLRLRKGVRQVDFN